MEEETTLLGIVFGLNAEKQQTLFSDESSLSSFVFSLNGDKTNLFPDKNELTGIVFKGNKIKEFLSL